MAAPPPLQDVDIANRALARIGEAPLVSLDDETDVANQVNAVYGDVVDAALAAYQWKWARRTEPLQRLTLPAPPPLNPPPTPVPAALAPPPPQPPYQGFPALAPPPPPTIPSPLFPTAASPLFPYAPPPPAPFPPAPPPIGYPLQPNPSPPGAPPAVPYPDMGPAPGPQNFNGWPYAFAFPANALGQPLALWVRWPGHPCREFAVEGAQVYARVPFLFGTFVRRIGPSEWSPTFRLAVSMWLAAELAVPITQDKDLAAQLMQAAVGAPSEQLRGGMIGRAIAFDVATGGQPTALADDPVTRARFDGPWYGGSEI